MRTPWLRFLLISLVLVSTKSPAPPIGAPREPAGPGPSRYQPTVGKDVVFIRVDDDEDPQKKRDRKIDQYLLGADMVFYTGNFQQGSPAATFKNAVVVHTDSSEAAMVQGGFNPLLDMEKDARLKKIYDQKWEEYLLMNRILPGMMPKTELMGNLVSELKLSFSQDRKQALTQVDAMLDALRERYPNGFFLKTVDSWNSEGLFVTDKSSSKVLNGYWKNLKAGMVATYKKTQGDETDKAIAVHDEFKEEKDYEGRILEAVMLNPNSVVVQERIDIDTIKVEWYDGTVHDVPNEYRVHVMEGGQILKSASLPEASAVMGRWDQTLNVTPELMAAIENTVERDLAKKSVPAWFKKSAFGLDVMLEKGAQITYENVKGVQKPFVKLKYVETNAGLGSGYLSEVPILAAMMAEHYTGKAPQILLDIREVLDAPDIATLGKLMEKFLSKKAIKPLIYWDLPISPFYQMVKKSLLARIRENGDNAEGRAAVEIFKTWDFTDYLAQSEVQEINNFMKKSDPDMVELEKHNETLLGRKKKSVRLSGSKGKDSGMLDAFFGTAFDEVSAKEWVKIKKDLKNASPSVQKQFEKLLEKVTNAQELRVATQALVSSPGCKLIGKKVRRASN